jgi:hypothetical protein
MAQSWKKSLFTGGKHSIAHALSDNAQKGLPPEEKETLLRQAALLDQEKDTFPDMPLSFTGNVLSRNVIVQRRHDLSSLAATYPEHKNLLKQLLHGVRLSNPDGVSASNLADSVKTVQCFIAFVNEPQAMSTFTVNAIRDIDALVLRSYSSFLPLDKKLKNRSSKLYRMLVRICDELWTRYEGHPEIGVRPGVPDSPAGPTNGAVTGYNSFQLKALIAACVKDIIAVKALHRRFDALDCNSKQFAAGTRMMFKPGPQYHEQKFSAVLATLKHQFPDYPFGMTLEDSSVFLTRQNPSRHVGVVKGAVDDCIAKIGFMDGRLGKTAIFAAQHFALDTLYPFFLLVLMHTGWNLESVATIPDDVDSSVMENPLNPEQDIILLGRKERGGTAGKVVHRRSRRYSPFGPYQLLKYVESVILRQRGSQHYVEGDLFQYVVGTFNYRTVRLVNTIRNNACRSGVFSRASSDFLKRHSLTELIGTTVDHVKARSGYATICEAGGLELQEIADQQMEHEKVSTTVTNYLSDASSNAVKDKIIDSLQRLYVNDLANYKLRIVESVSLQELRQAIENGRDEAARQDAIRNVAATSGLDEKTVVHVLSAEADTYILVCEDASSPTWTGHQEYVKGASCRYFNKCCLCEQAIVFPEALPYIARRIVDLEKEQSRLMSADWVFHYGEEYEAWKSILDSWSDKNAVESATIAATTGAVVLPHVMRGYW